MPNELKERALKIAEALYRTTDLFSDAEPLKWGLRQAALDVLGAEERDIMRLEGIIKNIMLKLELAASGTFISKMNFDVLKREYKNLLMAASSKKDDYQNLLDSILSDKILLDKRTEPDNQVVKANSPAPEITVTERKTNILAALEQKGRSSVGELAKTIGGGISEKTVQRELGALVTSGAIKQEGNKRWRRYFV